MAYFKKETGNLGESLAERFLQKSGYKILAKNLKLPLGEIDVLARRKSVIVVVEVKTKSSHEFGEGYEMVNSFKKHKLIQLAKSLQIKYPRQTIRIDIISVDTSTNPPEIKHFENAVEEN